MRAAGGCDKGAGRHGCYLLHCPRQVGPQRFGLADDVVGVSVPVGFTFSRQVVKPSQRVFTWKASFFNRGGRDGSQQLCAGGRSPLVVNHRQALALLRQLEHGLGKVTAVRGIDPAGAQDQMPRAMRLNLPLTLELGLAVDIERRGRIGF